jgi:cysteine-rich repeat protein
MQRSQDSTRNEACDDGNTALLLLYYCFTELKCGDALMQRSQDSTRNKACDEGNTALLLLYYCFTTALLLSLQRSFDETRNEACDDGNMESGDGCSTTCELEPGFICSTRREATSTCGKPTCVSVKQ